MGYRSFKTAGLLLSIDGSLIHYSIFRWIFAFHSVHMKYAVILIFLFFSIPGSAQLLPTPSYWQGELPSTKKLLVAFHFSTDSAGAINATMDSPGEGTLAIKCSDVQQRGDSLFLNIPTLKARFEGKLNNTAITARWKQGSLIVPLELKKTNFPVSYSKIKTQEPKPPFPYFSEDVEYNNADSSVHLGATITRPAKAGTYPAVILISGSGQQDRNEFMLGHKPFAVIADHLTRNGFMVMRVDDRGIGRSKGDLKKATTADFAKDVETSLDFLLKRNDVDRKKIGLIGHSEGGMIAPMVAVNRKEISFLILLAGPGYKIAEVMADQNEAILKQSGFSDSAAANYRKFYLQLVPAIANAPNDSLALLNGVGLFNVWQARENASVVTALTSVPQFSTPEKFIKIFVSQVRSAWWTFFINYDPEPALKQLKIPILALNGSRDIQILPKSAEHIKSIVQQTGNKKSQVYILPELNHLFQQCYYCVTAEYGQLEQTFSPLALKKISDWMNMITR